ncbi:MAG: PLP-dependent transferase [Pirellulaceae bacterium]|nr:PLP-dependent transferase [Pirellulaceae bacterium]
MNLAVDLRSDTVTKPCAAMRQAMASAIVDDDALGGDPTVDALQQRVAELLGKEAALFMPSGSMSNQIAVRLHCGRGDEFLCEANCHIYNYEQAAFAQLSGVVARTIPGIHGLMQPEQLADLIRPPADNLVRTTLVTLENTHNRGGGAVLPLDNVQAICRWAQDHGLATHLDGARLFNAVAATGIDAHVWSKSFDSVSICFSKGLGAPIGSALAGSQAFIRQARRARRLFGGGMRQVGVIAAAALYALEHNRQRIVEDHRHAQILADAIRNIDGVQLDPQPQTNIVIVKIAPQLGTATTLAAALKQHGIGVSQVGPQHIRFVTHLDVTEQQIHQASETLRQVVSLANK